MCKSISSEYVIDDIGIVDKDEDIKNIPDQDKIELVQKWLMMHMKPSKKKSNFTSYWLKHQAERNIGCYISNGVMIMALIASDYRIYRIPDSKNCCVYGVLDEKV